MQRAGRQPNENDPLSRQTQRNLINHVQGLLPACFVESFFVGNLEAAEAEKAAKRAARIAADKAYFNSVE